MLFPELGAESIDAIGEQPGLLECSQVPDPVLNGVCAMLLERLLGSVIPSAFRDLVWPSRRVQATTQIFKD
jgi:hypothetical protein